MSSLTTPAATLGYDEDDTPARALWAFTSGTIRLSGPKKWTRPKFNGATTTKRRRVNRNPAVASENVRFNSVLSWPASIPWSTTWKPGEGTDNACIITDPAEGVVWECQNLRYERPWDPIFSPLVVDNLHRRTPDCVVSEPHMSRGCGGVPSEAGLLTAVGARDGITSALALFAVNIQYGPGARIVAPAGRLEHPRVFDRAWLDMPSGDVPSMIPAGSRFATTWTDDEIDERAWRKVPAPDSTTTARRAAEAKRAALINIEVGLRDYGAAVLATASGTTYIETEGTNEPGARRVWESIGFRLDVDFRAALVDVFDPDHLKVVTPA